MCILVAPSWEVGKLARGLQNQLGLLVCSVVGKRSLDDQGQPTQSNVDPYCVKVQLMPPHLNCHRVRSHAVSWRVLLMLVLGYTNVGRGADCQ